MIPRNRLFVIFRDCRQAQVVSEKIFPLGMNNGPTKGESETAIRNAVIKFEQEFMGRGPDGGQGGNFIHNREAMRPGPKSVSRFPEQMRPSILTLAGTPVSVETMSEGVEREFPQ